MRRRVHGGGDLAPALHLLGRPQARRVGIAHALRRHGGGFRQDQARAGALRVVLGHQRIGHAPGLACMRVSGAMMTRLGRVRSPRTRGSNNRLMRLLLPRRLPGVAERTALHVLVQLPQECGDQGFVATEEHPLPDLGGRDQAGALQHGQMRDTVDWDSPQRPSMWPAQTPCSKVWPGRSSKYALGSFSHARISRRTGLASALRMASALTVVVAGGSGIRRIRVHIQISQFIESYIVKDRYMLIPPRRVGILAAFARQLRLVDAMPPGSREPCALIHRPPCRAAATSPCSTLRCTRRRCEARVAASAGAAFPCAPRAPWRSGARSPRRGSFPGCGTPVT